VARSSPEEMLFWVNNVVSGAPEAFSEAVSEEPASVQKLATVKAPLDGVAAAKERLEFLEANIGQGRKSSRKPVEGSAIYDGTIGSRTLRSARSS